MDAAIAVREGVKTGDENRQALMHANLLLTNLMRLLRPSMKPANTAQPDSTNQYAADKARFGVPKVNALKIGIELRNQYVLGHSPKNAARDGKYRRVQVKLVKTTGLPPLKAMFRTGYYAPTQ